MRVRTRPHSADSVEEVGFEVITAARIGVALALVIGAVASGYRDRRRQRDQHGEFAEVLGRGGEVKLVAGTVRSS